MHPELRLFNTETRQKDLLRPLQPGRITFYTCGPTVYAFPHIGNCRTFVFEDLLRRTLRYFGFTVTQVMNLTDVDDKTIRGATTQGVSLEAYTKPFKEAFFADMKTLNVDPADHYPAATEFIEEMIAVIETLLQKGVAYHGGDGSIYYAIAQFPPYGRLSHLKLNELQAGASERVASDEYEKDNVADFVLWKKYDPERDGVIFWDSPFGKGRPGWHLECSTMAMKLLGATIDIHAGGVDNIFPHHENEIAQSEAYSGQKFVNHWVHVEHLLVENRKMSKSLGNFFTLRDLLGKGFTGDQIRYLLIQTHYRTQLNFTFQALDAAKVSLQRLRDLISRLQQIAGQTHSLDLPSLLQRTRHAFEEGLSDDLNLSASLASLFDMVREVNSLCDQGKLGHDDATSVLDLLHRCDEVLGFLFPATTLLIPADIEALAQQRQQARKERNWAKADQLRDLLSQKGYQVEDTPSGPRLKKL